MKRVILLVLAIISSVTAVFSYTRPGHDNILKRVLFGSESSLLSDKGKRNLELIDDASYISIDFFNGTDKDTGNLNSKGKNAEDLLKKLKKAGVKNLPQAISETDYSAYPSNHRRYTHIGWEPIYVVNKGNWPKRREILQNTVEAVCGFRFDEKIKIEAFSAIIYYIHLLGDFENKGGEAGEAKTKDNILPMTSEDGYLHNESTENRKNNPTIYTELLYYIGRLFREQKQTKNYKKLEAFLRDNKDHFCDKKKPSKTMPSAVVDFATQTISALSTYLPPLLQGERFFKDTFLM